jgi:predicted transcriptional regulator
MPLSTAILHINVLEDAQLLRTEMKPGDRGVQKVCQRVFDTVIVDLPVPIEPTQPNIVEVSMPIGAYVDCDVTPTCGLVTDTNIIGFNDDPRSFFEPQHSEAQLLWFKQGYVEYRFPNRLPPKTTPDCLWLSMELCSEAPMHHPDWPSDITMWINGIELGTWTSPADFGGQRGVLTPDWWDSRNTQYGLLKEWRISHEGCYVDGVKLSETTLKDLTMTARAFVSVRIGVKDDAKHRGGVNLFGHKFGNYPQDMLMRIRYN